MSSILDAIEKANRKRQAGTSPEEELQSEAKSARERRLQQEAEEARRRSRQLGILLISISLLFTGCMIVLAVLYFQARHSKLDSQRVALKGAQSTVDVPQLKVTPAPSEVLPILIPSETPLSTPEPTPFAAPTPLPTPAPTPLPSPTPTPEPTKTPAPQFVPNQVVYPSELGITIQGVMEDGANSLILVDDQSLEIGRKYKGIRPISIRSGLIEVEFDQNGEQVPLFIRY